MANRERGELALRIGDVEYTLVLNTGAMARLEEHFSTPTKETTWDEVWARVLKGSVRTVRALLWAMLQTHHPSVTIEQAGVLIDQAGGFEGLIDILDKAGYQATPDPRDVKELGVAKSRPRTAQKSRLRRGTGAASSFTRDASV